MSAVARATIARRPLLVWLAGAAGLAVASIAVEAPRFFAPRYAPTPFDDVLVLLASRAGAMRLGAAYLSAQKSFDIGAAARLVRRRLAGQTLATALDADLAQSHLVEARGWVLPETLVTLCAIAAMAA